VDQGLDEEERHLMVTVARLIWLRRNKLVFEGIFQGPKSIVRVAREQVEAFNEATRRHCTHRPSNTVQEEVVWKKPPPGTLKFNWDAAVDKEGGRIGMGVIARDSVGEVVVMNSVLMDFVQDPSLAEALAARQAVELSLAMGLKNCIFEGDALEVIKAINQEEPCRGVISQIVNDIKTLLLQGGSWEMKHTRRGANGAAHLLAKTGLQISEAQTWNNILPEWMVDIVRNEQIL
jgi:hypothetical protein